LVEKPGRRIMFWISFVVYSLSGFVRSPLSFAFSRILLPGFSTNDTVTEYSGRGVGMDVVRSNIEQCGGTLTVESEEGKGSSFIIRISSFIIRRV